MATTQTTILQNYIFSEFIIPFILMFFIIFAVLDRSKIFGADKRQVNAFVAGAVALIFVSALYPKRVVGNLILFLTVAIVVIFVFLMLYGFIASGKDGLELETWMKRGGFVIIFVAVVIAVIWASGIEWGAIDLLFKQPWSNTFWTNFIFVAAIAGAMAVVIKTGSKKS